MRSRKPFGRRSVVRWALVGAVAGACAAAQPTRPVGPVGGRLVTGREVTPDPSWRLSPTIPGMPFNMALSPDGRYAVTLSGGHRHALAAVRSTDVGDVHTLGFDPTRKAPRPAADGLFYGLAFAGPTAVYAAGGGAGKVFRVSVAADGTLAEAGEIRCRPGDCPAGLAADARGRLFVASNNPLADRGTAPRAAAVIAYRTAADAGDHRDPELARYTFPATPLPAGGVVGGGVVGGGVVGGGVVGGGSPAIAGTSVFPLAVACARDGSRVFVTGERDGCVYAFDATADAELKLLATIPTGSHPAALALDDARGRLYVANAHGDTVTVIDTATDAVTATVLLRPDVCRDLAGVTPVGLCLSPDGRTLYAACADLNAVAVIDTATPALRGFVPAGWYPAAVAVAPDGRLLVCNAKGVDARHPNPPVGAKDATRPVTPLRLVEGRVVSQPAPAAADLPALTARALDDARLTTRFVAAADPLKGIDLAAPGGLRHVIYVVKENRTYDQVLGDDGRGDGDPGRAIFGRRVTPNLHALAARFVLLDNFYVCGEVSGDGWPWSTQGMANEYVSRYVPYLYSKRADFFNTEGSNDGYLTGGFPAAGPDGRPLSDSPAFRNGAPAVPDVAEAPGGHIWDAARRAGLTYRNYAFHYSSREAKGGRQDMPDNYPASGGLVPGGRDLGGVSDVDYRVFDLDYADSDAPRLAAAQTGNDQCLWPTKTYGSHAAPSRFAEWDAEFRQMLAKDPTGGGVPAFMTVRLGNDHTVGVNPGRHAPVGYVADNDYAVGELVEAVSRSPVWSSTAIFVVEDDAQNGPDHVDCHRSPCYVVSPFVRRGSVDHAFYNTASVLRTMELAMRLPPLCQYDAIAAPVDDWTARPDNAEPYAATLPPADLFAARNGLLNRVSPVSPEAMLLRKAAGMDFTVADRAPAGELNDAIWKSVKGWDAVPPPTPHGPADVGTARPPADDDDDD